MRTIIPLSSSYRLLLLCSENLAILLILLLASSRISRRLRRLVRARSAAWQSFRAVKSTITEPRVGFVREEQLS